MAAASGGSSGGGGGRVGWGIEARLCGGGGRGGQDGLWFTLLSIPPSRSLHSLLQTSVSWGREGRGRGKLMVAVYTIFIGISPVLGVVMPAGCLCLLLTWLPSGRSVM